MRVIVLGAGHVGQTLVDVLHAKHDLTVIDVDGNRLARLADRYDVRTVVGDGTTRKIVQKAGVDDAHLVLACSPREEANLVCAMLAKRLSSATTIVRTTSTELFDAWREGELDVDVMVSPELETAKAIAAVVGLPAARHADTFADGRVQVVEFDVPHDGAPGSLVGCALRDATVPDESKVACLVRGGRTIVARGDACILPGDRLIVIGSPHAARAWSRALAPGVEAIHDVVVFGAGRMGTAISRRLVDNGLDVRLVETDVERARAAAAELPEVRVLHADGHDRAFLARQRMDRAAAVYALNDDAKNLFAALLARVHGVRMTIALVHDPASAEVYDLGGVDVAINPRELTAAEMVRFAHDSRVRQVSMLERHKLEVVDIGIRSGSRLAGRPLRELSSEGGIIGAVIRDGTAVFPHGNDELRGGDRAIMLLDATKVDDAARLL